MFCWFYGGFKSTVEGKKNVEVEVIEDLKDLKNVEVGIFWMIILSLYINCPCDTV